MLGMGEGKVLGKADDAGRAADIDRRQGATDGRSKRGRLPPTDLPAANVVAFPRLTLPLKRGRSVAYSSSSYVNANLVP